MTSFSCDDFRDRAPDLALGLLAGDERGRAITHLTGCQPCQRHLEGLAQVADDLLLLAPSVEPEVGFESRVMGRLDAAGAFSSPAIEPAATAVPSSGGQTPPPSPIRRRWARPTQMAVAAALFLILGVVGAWAGLTASRGSPPPGNQSAALAARAVVIRADGGRSTCQLVAFPGQGGQPARLVINLDEPAEASSSYQVLVEPTAGGPAVLVGSITVTHGHGTLTTTVPAGTGPVDAVRIVDSPSSVRYRATFQSV